MYLQKSHGDSHVLEEELKDEDSTPLYHHKLSKGRLQPFKIGLPTPSQTEKKIGNAGVGYKMIETPRIVESIQLGIQRSVGGLSARPERDVLMRDFMTVESTSFTSGDTKSTQCTGFVFKTYAPIAFRHFRDLFGILQANYVSAFCKAPLIELQNPGASGSLFYLTQNDEFITKTVQHREAMFLLKLLPGYYLNLNQNPNTLLPKFFGLYCYKNNKTTVRLAVMNNVLPTSVEIHQKYDLKGSTFNRRASKSELEKHSPTFKDLDFTVHYPQGIFLEYDVYETLKKTIQRDCRVLESFQIMDYSLLLGVHDIGLNKKDQEEKYAGEETANLILGDGNFINETRHCLISGKSKQFMEAETSCNSKNIAIAVKKEKLKHPSLTGIPARKANGEKLFLFIGIIDILQSYRFKKKIEHAWKSIFHDGNEISVHNPGFYARRFEEFVFTKVLKVTPISQTIKRKGVLKLKPDE